MILTELCLTDFRNFASAEVVFRGGVVLIEGRNAQGKSNLLEAAFVLSALQPLRAHSLRDAVRFGAQRFGLQGRTDEGRRVYNVIGDGQTRRLSQDGRPLAAGQWEPRGLRPVALLPEDIALAAESGEARRRYLDEIAATMAPGHGPALAAARRTVAQRARALVDGGADLWDDPLAAAYAAVAEGRRRAAAGLQEILPAVVETFGEPEKVEAVYRPTVPSLTEPVERAAAAEAVRRALLEARPRETAAGVCLVGPHRDEVQVLVGGRDLRRFGSRGQMRTVAIALRVAEAETVRRHAGVDPILLIDDVLPELDETRQRLVAQRAMAAPQAIVACAERGRVLTPEMAAGGWWRVEAGAILPPG